ncbi:hypothetical protein [Aurantimonas coralicida]|uniref:hypothetical protein n=1 Tax=Aurantimonas coralicida TaxID=182270 RepID=UPI001E5B3E03|nr:hypothetical protein [Aurantimonas coralicida]MCD1645233.1 hypothetical protein [Aurantimonas coralicida]
MAITAVDALIEPVTIAVTNRGPAGVAATVEIGTVTSLEPGGDSTVANSGTDTHAVLNFGLVQGDPGDAGSVAIGTVTTLDAGSSATVTNAGSASDAVLNFGIPKGDKGDPPDLTLGTITTGAAGSLASGSLTETDPDVYELTLTIPRGDTGAVEDIVAADITDATAAGIAILTAADVTAQRTALELGTAALSAAADFATAAQGELADTATQPGDLGSAAALNAGTGASEVVQLNGSAQLPAVDGSLLTGLPEAGQPIPTTSSFAVGTLLLCQKALGSAVANGATTAGSNLEVGSAGNNNANPGGTLSGTWKNVNGSTLNQYEHGYFVRTA